MAYRKKDIDQTYKVGDLVYYRGFNVFPNKPSRRYIGIVIALPDGQPHYSTYTIFWFDSGLTTRMHHDNIEAVSKAVESNSDLE